MTATDAATEVVAEVAEEVAEQAQHVADVSRGLSGRGAGLAFGAFLIGSGVGGGLTYLLTRRRLETKFSKIADDEIAEMREHYQNKVLALEATAGKEDLADIVSERGYTSPDNETTNPPMAVSPPAAVVEQAKEELLEDQERDEEILEEASETRNVFRDTEGGDVQDSEWDWEAEKRNRSAKKPYVIHYDERYETEDYTEITLTYYEGDDVLCNERDEVIGIENRDSMVGEKNLERFGHGSKDDPNVVYVRNDALELTMEVVKSPNSYTEEVHGLKHTGYGRNLERMRAREREQSEDD